jgi:hypothetical protein
MSSKSTPSLSEVKARVQKAKEDVVDDTVEGDVDEEDESDDAHDGNTHGSESTNHLPEAVSERLLFDFVDRR